MVLADKLGFDGLVLNEHHNTQYSMNPAPNLTAAALIPQTKGWISVFGTPPNLGYPNRLAEEYAMLDVMSGGRLRVAFPLGTGHGVLGQRGQPGDRPGPLPRVDRHHPAVLDQDGPQSYAGDFYTYRYLNPWPKPMQQPHPRVLHRRHRLARDDRAGRRARLRLLGRVHPDDGAAARCSTTTASASPTTATSRRPTR